MAREFLAETWDSCVHTKAHTLDLMGSTPAEDLLRTLEARDSMDILLVDSEDIRHFLKTVAGLTDRPKHATRPQTLNFHLMDGDEVVTARNCLLTELALNVVDPANKNDLLFLWCVWYNADLSTEHHARLLKVLDALLKKAKGQTDGAATWSFGNQSTKSACMEVWRAWKVDRHNTSKTKKRRIMQINSLDPAVIAAYFVGHVPVPDYVREDLDIWQSCGMAEAVPWAWALNDLESVSEYARQAKNWITEGSGQPSDWGRLPKKTVINPTMMRPGQSEWLVHDVAATPFHTYWEMGPKASGKRLPMIDACGKALKLMLASFRENIKSVKVHVKLWAGAHTRLLSSPTILPASLTFDIIHTKALVAQLGVLSVLLCCVPRLKDRNSVLLVSSARAFIKHSDSKHTFGSFDIPEFLQEHLGCEATLLPTLLGVHLAEDQNMGITKLPASPQASPISMLLCWMKSEANEQGKLSLKDSPDLRKALQNILRLCFVQPKGGREDSKRVESTPLAAQTVLMRLEPYVQGGMRELLAEAAKLRPAKGKSGGDPFYVCCRAQLAAYGYLALAGVREDDQLLCVRMPSPYDVPTGDEPGAVGQSVKSKWLLTAADPHLVLERQMLALIDGDPNNPETDFNALVASSPHHLFPNYKLYPDTQHVEWLMLRSDWSELSPKAGGYMTVEGSDAWTVERTASIKHVWKVKARAGDKQPAAAASAAATSEKPQKKAEVRQITESLHAYKVEMEVLAKNATITVDNLSAGKDNQRTNRLQLGISSKGWVRRETVLLSFSCNIDVTAVQITGSQQVTVAVPKHTLWNSGPALQPRLGIDPGASPSLRRQQLQMLLQGNDGLLNKMFCGPRERLLRKMGKILQTLSCGLRDCIQMIWERACETPPMSICGMSTDPQAKRPRLDLLVRGYYLHDDMPAMHVTYADRRAAEAMVERGDMLYGDMQRQIAKHIGYDLDDLTLELVHPEDSCSCCQMLKAEQKEIDLVKKILLGNSFITPQPTEADRLPWIRDSFIQLYFPRFLVKWDEFKLEMDEYHKLMRGEHSTLASMVLTSRSSKDPDLKCVVCGQQGHTYTCSKCKKTEYCSRTCQRADWPTHKKTCKAPTRSEAQSLLENDEMSAKDSMSLPRVEPRGKSGPESTNGGVNPSSQSAKETSRPTENGDVRPKTSEGRGSSLREKHECKVCQKVGDDLQPRLVYYCSIGCHEDDTGKTYPVDASYFHKPDSGGDGPKETPAVTVQKAMSMPTDGGGDSVRKFCDFCGRRSCTSEPCVHCAEVRYCSSACAQGDWPQHRSVCKRK